MPVQRSFDLLSTYVHLDDAHGATPIAVTDTFWSDLVAGNRPELDAGWLVAAFAYDGDWPTAEMHPAGDEIVHLLSGYIDVVLERRDGDHVVALQAGATVVVPRGTWHTARVRTPGHALHITPGAGTQHRPARA